jgi:hypothetical protein
MIHPIFIVILSLPEIYALLVAFWKTKNFYVIMALLKTLILCALYSYIWFVDPPIDTVRIVARTALVLMQSIGTGAAIIYLRERK